MHNGRIQVDDDYSSSDDERDPLFDPGQPVQLSTMFIVAGAVSTFIFFFGIASIFDNNLPTAITVKEAHIYNKSFIGESALFNLEILSSFGPKVVGSRQNEVLAVEFIKTRIESIITEAKVKKSGGANGIMYDVQKASGCFNNDGIYCYQNITNVVVMVGLSENSESILVNCHFDSVPYSSGTSDDNLNCAVMLEIISVLVSSPDHRLLRNVVFLFNGAEEVGLMGSHAFITQHKWSNGVRAFINLESAGAGGREMLFQSSPGQHNLVKAYSKSVPYPSGNVFAEELYETGLIPSTTDYEIFHEFGGLPGLDIAHYKNGFVYHTKYDTINRVKVDEIQHTGDNILALVKRVADVRTSLDLNKHKDKALASNRGISQNFVYYDVFGLFMVNMPKDLAMELNSMVVILSLMSIVALGYDLKLFGMLLKDTTIMVVGFILVILVNGSVSTFLNDFGGTMSWYGNEIMIFPLYVIPAVLALAFPVVLSHSFQVEQDDPMRYGRDRHVLSFIKSVQLMWTLMLWFLSSHGIRSSCLFSVMLLPVTIIGGLLTVAHHYHRIATRNMIVMHLAGCAISSLYVIYLGIELTNFIIPLMGRIGEGMNPEFIVGPLIAFLTILVVGYFISLVLYADDVWHNIWTLSMIIGLVVATAMNATMYEPYDSNHHNPRPQRFYVVHLNRNFPTGSAFPNVPESGFVIYPMDYRAKNTLDKYVGASDLTTLYEQCENADLRCGVPLLHIRERKVLNRSYWLNAPKPEIDKPTEQIVHKDLSNMNSFDELHNGPSFNFNLTVGSKWLEVFFYLEEGIEMRDIIMGDTVESVNPFWNEDRMYHIRYARGQTTDDTWIFSVIFRVSDILTYRRILYYDAPVFRLFVCTHYIDQTKTEDYTKFLNRFPTWAHVASLVTDCSTTYH